MALTPSVFVGNCVGMESGDVARDLARVAGELPTRHKDLPGGAFIFGFSSEELAMRVRVAATSRSYRFAHDYRIKKAFRRIADTDSEGSEAPGKESCSVGC